jgi:tryptophanyl-tRNA synthetase
MSKSLPNGTLDLLAPVKTSIKRIKSAVTDTEREIRYDEQDKPGVSNLLGLLSELREVPIADLEREYAGRGYGDLKGGLAEAFAAFVEPVQARVQDYLADPAQLDKVLSAGAERARLVAGATAATVYDKIGLFSS